MAIDSEGVLRAALTLPARERAEMAAELLASLEAGMLAKGAPRLDMRASRGPNTVSRMSSWFDSIFGIGDRVGAVVIILLGGLMLVLGVGMVRGPAPLAVTLVFLGAGVALLTIGVLAWLRRTRS